MQMHTRKGTKNHRCSNGLVCRAWYNQVTVLLRQSVEDVVSYNFFEAQSVEGVVLYCVYYCWVRTSLLPPITTVYCIYDSKNTKHAGLRAGFRAPVR